MVVESINTSEVPNYNALSPDILYSHPYQRKGMVLVEVVFMAQALLAGGWPQPRGPVPYKGAPLTWQTIMFA